MSKKTWWMIASLLLVVSMLLAACGPSPTPETIVETVVVTVEKEGEIVEVIVTATPEPEMPVEFKSADPTTLYDIVGAGDTDTLDPAWNYESAGDAIILNVYDQLVTYAGPSATEFVPALAEDWDISPDGLIYTFYVREGVTFHNGAELTPEDVAYSLQRGVLQGGTWSPQWLFTEPFFGEGIYDIAELVDPTGALDDDPEGLQAADPEALMAACEAAMNAIQYDDAAGTVTFTLAQSWGPFLPTLAQSWGSILDKDWAIENGTWDGDCATWQNYYGVTSETAPLRDIMNGSGPYMFDHWTPGEETVLVKNPNYWRTEPTFEGGATGPTIDRIVKKLVNEWGTRYAMLQAGDSDITYIPRENIAQVDPMVGVWCEYNFDTLGYDCEPTENPDAPLILYKGAPSATRTDAFFVFDIDVEGGNPYIGSGELDGNGIPADFFSDEHVRKAFNYCFDWDAYIADALAGEGIQNVGYLIPGMIGYDPNGPKYTFDPAMCEEELKLAWDGAVWENGFRFQIGYNTGNVTRQTIAQILQATFSDIDPKFNIEIIGLPWPSFLAAYRASRLPMAVTGWIEDLHDPHNWAQPFLIGTYASRQRMPDWMVDEFQVLVSEGVGAPTDEARAEIYKQLTQLDYNYAPAIRLAVATGRAYFPRWISGYYYNPIHQLDSRYYTLTKQ
ncbi:MAG: ABC transporter substrate-binding protein [Anaerolineae bacterium]|nr:ABC transporter substrate-binding protein [Anaerolineae bacterium]